jgi:hypothetical protein
VKTDQRVGKQYRPIHIDYQHLQIVDVLFLLYLSYQVKHQTKYSVHYHRNQLFEKSDFQ